MGKGQELTRIGFIKPCLLGIPVAVSCGVGRRCGSDPMWGWLWRRLAAAAPIRPLAWEPPYAAGAAQEIAKRPKKKKKNHGIHISLSNNKYSIKLCLLLR